MGSLLKVISSNSILGILDSLVDAIIGRVLGPVLWGLCSIFFVILNMFEGLYKKFAGIEEIYILGEPVNQDPVLYLINTNVVQEMFFSILILSLILLIIFTIFAIVKNIYTEKPKPIAEIINSSVKALLMYLLVPVATVVCLLVGNVVLRGIDGATRTPGAGNMSDALFMSAAYEANKLRGPAFGDWEKVAILNTMLVEGILDPMETYQDTAEYKNYVSTMLKHNIDVNKWGIQDVQVTDWEEVATAIDKAYMAGLFPLSVGGKWLWTTVMPYYDILSINIILIWAGGAFMIWSLGKITWGLIARMFKMTVYFAISPALMALFPIKGDGMLKSWTGEMVKNGTMAYCAVGVLNVVLAILPAFTQLKLFGIHVVDSLVVLLVDIVALASAEKLIGTLSGWFGTGDALAEGKATASAVKKPITDVSKKTVGTFAGMRGGWKAAEDQQKGFWGKVGGALTGAASQTGFVKAYKENQKLFQDSKKGGDEFYKNIKTKDMLGEDRKPELWEYEGREAAAKEAKIIRGKIDDLNALRTRELSSTTDPAKRSEINKRYDNEVEELMENASFVKSVHGSREKILESRQKALDKKNTRLKTFDDMIELQTDDETLMKLFMNRAGIASLDRGQWNKIKAGDIAGAGLSTADQASATATVGAFTSQITEINQREERTIRAIQDAYDSSEKTQAEMQAIIPGFTGDLRNITDANLTLLKDSRAKRSAEASDIESGLKALATDKRRTFANVDSLTDEEARRIGKNNSK